MLIVSYSVSNSLPMILNKHSVLQILVSLPKGLGRAGVVPFTNKQDTNILLNVFRINTNRHLLSVLSQSKCRN